MLTPIPISVLIDSATHSPLVTGARGKTYTPSNSLTNVLIQNKKVRTVSNDNVIMTSDAILFYDMSNSNGMTTFKIGDQITFLDGFGASHDKYIKSIVEAKTNNGIHHYELMLS